MAYKKDLQETLINAVEQGDLQSAACCIQKGADVNDIPWGTESLLMRAIRCRHSRVAKLLIDNCVDTKYQYLVSESPRKCKTAKDYCDYYNMPDVRDAIERH
ncbi:uncharacterized protein LOC144450502 [Glandiceps talaboti]